jgi:hypothetical protein
MTYRQLVSTIDAAGMKKCMRIFDVIRGMAAISAGLCRMVRRGDAVEGAVEGAFDGRVVGGFQVEFQFVGVSRCEAGEGDG